MPMQADRARRLAYGDRVARLLTDIIDITRPATPQIADLPKRALLVCHA
jgi:hypothetical protein